MSEMKINSILSLLLILVTATSCFKSDRQKVTERVTQFIQCYNWQGPIHVLDMLKKAKKTTEHLGPHFQLSLQARETLFKLNDLKQFKQNYALLRKVCPQLKVEMKAPRIDQESTRYLVKTTLEAKCDQADQDTIFYQFYLEEIDDDWLIVKGENEPIFE